MSTAMMSAPSLAIRTACARPWPRAAPVMKATLPASLPLMSPPRCSLLVCPANATTCSSLRRPDEVRPDDQALNLTGALVQPQQAHVTVDAFDRNAVHVAAAAVNLHREICDLAGHFGAEEVRRRRRDPAILVGDPQPRGVADKRPAGENPG